MIVRSVWAAPRRAIEPSKGKCQRATLVGSGVRLIGPRGAGALRPGPGSQGHSDQSRGWPPGLSSFAACACWSGTYASWLPRVWRSEIRRVSMLGVYLSRGRPPGSHVTELADLKMPGALEAVDGVLAEVDRGAVTAGEALELVLNARLALRNNWSAVVPGHTCWRPSIGVVPGGPATLVERRATLTLVNRASRPRVVVSCRAQRARFSPTRPPGGEGGRVDGGRRGKGSGHAPLCCPLARVSGGRCRGGKRAVCGQRHRMAPWEAPALGARAAGGTCGTGGAAWNGTPSLASATGRSRRSTRPTCRRSSLRSGASWRRRPVLLTSAGEVRGAEWTAAGWGTTRMAQPSRSRRFASRTKG